MTRVWMLKKAQKIDMKVPQKSFIGNSAEFENDSRLNMGASEEISGVGQNGKTEETV